MSDTTSVDSAMLAASRVCVGDFVKVTGFAHRNRPHTDCRGTAGRVIDAGAGNNGGWLTVAFPDNTFAKYRRGALTKVNDDEQEVSARIQTA